MVVDGGSLMTHAIILAAGKGTRMGEYTTNIPKALLRIKEKTLIQRQVDTLPRAGIENISVVTGYRSEMINVSGVRKFHNENYDTTNMVESLMCARESFSGDILIAYADILYTSKLIERMLKAKVDVGVAVDNSWRQMWMARFGTAEVDLESLDISDDGSIIEIGKPKQNSSGIDYRYIGLLKFSDLGIREMLSIYDSKCQTNSNWCASGNEFHQGYMTDLLSEMIGRCIRVDPVITSNGWWEFDTAEDYQCANRLLEKNDSIKGFLEGAQWIQ